MGKVKLRKLLQDNLKSLYLTGKGKAKHGIKNQYNSTPLIHSTSTYKSYKKQLNYFIEWCYKNDHRTLEAAGDPENVQRYLDECTQKGESAWTVNLKACAIVKALNTNTRDMNLTLPKRERAAVRRSRHQVEKDKHFSVENNKDLLTFGRCTGLRKFELEALTGSQLIEKSGHYYLRVKGKGGKIREALIIGTKEEKAMIIKRCKMAGDGKVWTHIHSGLDEHALRGQYACRMYKAVEKKRPLDSIPKPDRYICRRDKAGTVYDRKIMRFISNNLGHERIGVIASSYLYNL